MSHLRAGSKRNLLPKIGGARKKWFHQDPVPSTDGGVSFLCPLSSSRSGTCASLLVRKQATAFLTTEYSELVPAKPGLLPSFYWYHFFNESPTSDAILLLLCWPAFWSSFWRLALPAVKDQEMAWQDSLGQGQVSEPRFSLRQFGSQSSKVGKVSVMSYERT